MVWSTEWPATKATARELAAVGLTAPELAETLFVEVPAETSTGSGLVTPENSWMVIAMEVGDATVTATAVTGLVLTAYHISPSESCPAELKAPIFFQVLLDESDT